MINSKQKGKRGELEAVRLLRDLGFDARRGQQFKGTPDSPDIIIEDLLQVHVEVKRTEQFSPEKALAQAEKDAEDKWPVVLHRKSNKPWIAVVRPDLLFKLLKEVFTR